MLSKAFQPGVRVAASKCASLGHRPVTSPRSVGGTHEQFRSPAAAETESPLQQHLPWPTLPLMATASRWLRFAIRAWRTLSSCTSFVSVCFSEDWASLASFVRSSLITSAICRKSSSTLPAGKVEEDFLQMAEVMSEDLTKDAREAQSSEKQTETKLVQELSVRHARMAKRSQRLAVAINGRVGHGKCCCSGDSVSAAAGDLNCSWVPPTDLGDVTGRCPSDALLLAATWTAGYGGDHELLARGVDSCAASQGWRDAVTSLTRPLAGASAELP